MTLDEEIAAIVLEVSEMDDRTSPDDWPEALLLTAEELTDHLQRAAAAGARAAWPQEITPALNEILGTICFQVIGLVGWYRKFGFVIRRRAEDEQAFAIHRKLMHWFKFGDDGWAASMSRELVDLKRENDEAAGS